ncbi:MAG: hypothetical protein ACXWXS_05295 [Actinomycetota bacterium]
MHDLEQDIRRILDEDAHDAPLISSAPADITRQVRRRQLRFATLASLCTVAIGIGLFVGFRAFTPSDGEVPGEGTHPDEIASGTYPWPWWLTAREVDGKAQLVFHRPGETTTTWPDAPEHVFAIVGESFLEPSAGITEPSYWMVMGIVVPQTARVEVRLEGGRTVVADLVPLPAGVLGSNKAFIALDLTDDPSSHVPPDGTIVALDASGAELDRQVLALPRSRNGQSEARMNLRNAFVAALTYHTDGSTFVGFTPTVAASLEPSLTYNVASDAVTDEISIRDVQKDALVLVTRSKDGIVWCIAQQDTDGGQTTYGVVDAQTATECVGGDASWAVSPSSATPTPSSSPSSTESSMHGIASGTDLGETWTLSGSLDSDQYCLQFETDNTGSGTCSAAAQGGPPPGPPEDRPAQATTIRVSIGEFLVETVPNSVDRIEVTTPSGETLIGLCADPHLIPKLMSRRIRFCVVPLARSGDGTMRFLAADGAQAFPSRSITWNDDGSGGSTGSSGSSG